MSETQSTSEQFSADYRYAGFWHRFAALFIDGLILLIPNIVLNHVLPVVGSVLLVLFYKPIFESSPLLATPGKSLMGIIVLSEDGGRLNYKQALIRTLMSFVSGMCLLLGYFLSLFTERHQALHDLVAGSIVIYQDMPKENYFDIWLNEMKFVFGRGASEIFNSGARAEGPEPASGSESGTPVSRAAEARPSGFSSKGIDASAVEALSKLHKLLVDGAISEAEYAEKKAELLKRI